jgi:hypothetical protein
LSFGRKETVENELNKKKKKSDDGDKKGDGTKKKTEL